MAIFRKVHTSFWSDSFISELEADKKLFFLYLITNEKTKQCGIYEITKRQISFDLGYSIDRVSKLLEYFKSQGKIVYNESTKELALKNWLKFNESSSPKVQSCINKEFQSIKDTLLIEYVKSMDTRSQEEKNKNKNKNKNKSEEKQDVSLIEKNNFSDEDFRLAELLFNLILNTNPNHKKPNLKKWAEEIRLMRERDNRIPADIEILIHWCQQDPFWKSNILSTKKLREKYDQLIIKAKTQYETSNNTGINEQEIIANLKKY